MTPSPDDRVTGRRLAVAAFLLAIVLGRPAIASAQQPATPKTFALVDLQEAAVQTDPRVKELDLTAREADLRLKNVAAARLPAVTANGTAQVQSDVPRIPLTLPGEPGIPTPPKATYDASVSVTQSVVDATLGAQADLLRAQRDEAQAQVKAALFAVRQQVNDAFFAAASLQERGRSIDATIADLEARLKETNARVQNGSALPADASLVEATLLERREDADEMRADRHAALAILAKLTGQSISDDDELTLPDLDSAVNGARSTPDLPHVRPEFGLFSAERSRLDRQSTADHAQDAPHVWAFGKVGYGKPGLDFISNSSETYGLGGIQVQWKGWTWGTTSREQADLDLQRQAVDAEQAAFVRGLDEGTQNNLATIDRLHRAVTTDARIVQLREDVAANMQVRLNEGAVTAADYLDRDTELLQARLARAAHMVNLAQASARFLTTLGLEVR